MRTITALGANVVRETVRGKFFAFYVLALVLVAWFAPRLAEGDELLSALQVTVVYGLGLPGVLIAVATLTVAVGSMGAEHDRRHLELLLSKPVSRWQALAGKFVGIVGLDAALLLVVTVVFAVRVETLLSDQAPGSELDTATSRFLVPRRGVRPAPPPVDPGQLERLRGRLLEAEEARAPRREVSDPERLGTRARRILESWRIPAGGEVTMAFEGVPDTPDGHDLVLAFEVGVDSWTAPLEVAVRWRATTTEGREFSRALAVVRGTRNHVVLPADTSTPGGVLRLSVRNEAPPSPESDGTRIVIDPSRVEVLVASGRFLPNVARALLIVLAGLSFLAALGLASGALFSVPTAGLLTAAAYLVGLGAGTIRASVGDFAAHGSDASAALITWISGAVLFLVPDLGGESSLGRLVDGRAVDALALARTAGAEFLGRSVVLLVAGAFLWRLREPGRAGS